MEIRKLISWIFKRIVYKKSYIISINIGVEIVMISALILYGGYYGIISVLEWVLHFAEYAVIISSNQNYVLRK